MTDTKTGRQLTSLSRCPLPYQAAVCRQLYKHVALPSADGLKGGLKGGYSYILAQRIGDGKETCK